MYQLTQQKFWGILALIISVMFVAFMVTGCGGNDDDDDDGTTGAVGNDDDDDDVGPPDATTVTVDPAPGGAEIPSSTQFTLTFDQGVTAATVNGAAASGAGTNWTASPALQQGPGQSLNIEWTNRSGSTGSKAVGPYTITDPDVDPPVTTSQTVNDGDADVDPAPINQGGLRFDFDEPITGTVKLTDEAGADLNWQSSVAGQTATLNAIAGQELANETTYKVEIAVEDSSGNKTTTTITFVTKPKE